MTSTFPYLKPKYTHNTLDTSACARSKYKYSHRTWYKPRPFRERDHRATMRPADEDSTSVAGQNLFIASTR